MAIPLILTDYAQNYAHKFNELMSEIYCIKHNVYMAAMKSNNDS